MSVSVSSSGSGKEVSVSSGLDAVSHRVAVVVLHQPFGVYKVYDNLRNEKQKEPGGSGEGVESRQKHTCFLHVHTCFLYVHTCTDGYTLDE